MKTRFAPSPTGYLHIGNLHTALFNALLAYSAQGQFYLRIEDTDHVRSDKKFIQAIQEDLQWLGLYWSTTFDQPFILQSKRYALHEKYYASLINKGVAYPCFCTEERLAQLKMAQTAQHQPPGYDGKCYHLSSKVVKQRMEERMSYHLRFAVPKHHVIAFNDLLKGPQTFKSNALFDFVIRRSNGVPNFLYCNALDDTLMGITHVLRGEDHISNTAKQILLLEALNLPLPQYGHLPLMTMQDNAPLSKRSNHFHLKTLKTLGYCKLAILNYLARVGHILQDKKVMSLNTLAKNFTLQRISKSAAHFDVQQLNFWQKQVMTLQTQDDFIASLSPKIQPLIPLALQHLFTQAIQPIILFKKEAEEWVILLFTSSITYTIESEEILLATNKKNWETVTQIFSKKNSDLQDMVTEFKTVMRQISDMSQRKELWKTLRIALTNRLTGPELSSVLLLLGVERINQRLTTATHLISKGV